MRAEGGRGFASAIVEAALIAGWRGGSFQGEHPWSIDGIGGIDDIDMMSQRWAIAHYYYP
jgi:hypothetical protein